MAHSFLVRIGVIVVVAVVACSMQAQALYEDQAGTVDWMTEHIGAPTHAVAVGKRTFVASKRAVLACIGTRTGSLVWRRVLHEDDVVDSLLIKKSMLFTLSSNGKAARMWYAPAGDLMWDAFLYSDVDEEEAPVAGLSANNDATWVTVGGVAHIAIMSRGSLILLQAGSGEEVWRFEPPASHGCVLSSVHTATSSDASVVVGCSSSASQRLSRVYELTGSDGSVLHTYDVSSTLDGAHEVALVSSDAYGAVLASITTSGGVNVQSLDGAASAGIAASDLESMATAFDTNSSSSTFRSPGAVSVTLGGTGQHAVVKIAESGSTKRSSKGSLSLSVAFTTTDDDVVVGVADGGDVAVAAYVTSQAAVINTIPLTSGAGSVATTSVANLHSGVSRAVRTVVPLPFKGKSGDGVRVLVVTEDDAVHMLRSGRDKPLWTREEALAAVVSVETVDASMGLPNTHVKLAHGGSAVEDEAVDLSFGTRMRLQLEEATSALELLQRLATDPMEVLTAKDSTDATFGFNKTSVLMTECGKVFGLRAQTGDLVWSSTFPAGSQLFQTRHRVTVNHPPEIAIVYQSAAGVYTVDFVLAETGAPVSTETTTVTNTRLVSRLPVLDAFHRHVLMLVDESNMITLVPNTELTRAKFAKFAKNFVFNIVDATNGVITGYAAGELVGDQFSSVEAWKVVIPASANETIVGVAESDPDEPQPLPARVLGDDSLLLKYLNPHLLVVATSHNVTATSSTGMRKSVRMITIRVIDSVSGNVLDARSHSNARPPVLIDTQENWVQYTYWNAKARWQEIGSLVLYDGAMDRFALNPMKGYNGTDKFSSFDPSAPTVLARSFVLPATVVALKATRTANSITARHLLMALEDGTVMSMDRRMVDPRRPSGTPTAQEKAEKLPQYMPHLPKLHLAALSYNLTVARVRVIASNPTLLESTSTVLAAGLDLFYTHVQPSKDFDVLAEDFNKPLLIVLTTALFVGTYLARAAVRRKQLNASWA